MFGNLRNLTREGYKYTKRLYVLYEYNIVHVFPWTKTTVVENNLLTRTYEPPESHSERRGYFASCPLRLATPS